MIKSKLLLAQITFLSTIILSSYASDNSSEQRDKSSAYSRNFFGLGNFDDGFDYSDLNYKPLKPQLLNHAFVPNSKGQMQDRSSFKLHFLGEEDPSIVRIITKVPNEQYTFREKVNYLIKDTESYSFLTGTMTGEGVLTNGHGFIEKVPSFKNKLREIIGSEKFDYRTLEPVIIEQGLTWKHFIFAP